MREELRVLDLFSGCGGLSLGFQKAGFDVVGAVDNWKPAIETYRANFNHDIFELNLGNVELSVQKLKEFRPDMIIGGPPCQDFSHAGKRDETRGRADLTVAYARIISKIKPRFFLMENVDQITKSEKLVEARKIFKKANYGLTEKVLDASYCGVPQRRKRFFMIGVLGGKDGALLEVIENKLSKSPMTVREYFGKKLKIDYYYRHPRNYNRRGVFSVNEPSPTIRGVNRPIPKGYPGHLLDAEKELALVRPLTTGERARVQTFPEEFVFTGSKTEIEQQIGNAVPVDLGYFVALCLREHLWGPKPITPKQYMEPSQHLLAFK